MSPRIAELDGLRGLAITMVVLWHYFVQAIQVAPGSAPAYGLAMLGLTWSGVDLFFVLSGFLIGGILLDAKSSENYYRTFYARRFLRIVPLYTVWLVFLVLGIWSTRSFHSGWLAGIFNQKIPLWSYPLFLQNFPMAVQQSWGGSWATVSWSLAVEEQFYLLLPLVIRSLSRTALIRTAFVAVACAPMLRLILYFSGNHYFGPYVLLPCRIDALAAGLLIALAVRSASVVKFVASRRPQLLVALAVLGAGVGLLTFRHQHIILASFGYTWLAAFYSCLLLLVVVEPGRIAKAIFRSAILVQAGTIAYGVYLFHAGANNLIHGLLFGNGAVITHWGETAATVLSLAGVVFIAKLSWRFFEAPLIGLGHRIFRYQPRHPLGFAALPARAGAR